MEALKEKTKAVSIRVKEKIIELGNKAKEELTVEKLKERKAQLDEMFSPEKMEKYQEALKPENIKAKLNEYKEKAVNLKASMMGGTKKKGSIFDLFTDVRIDKCTKKLGYTEKDMTILYTVFNDNDKEGLGYITTDDLMKLLEEKRTAYSDAILSLIDTKNPEMLTFGECVIHPSCRDAPCDPSNPNPNPNPHHQLN